MSRLTRGLIVAFSFLLTVAGPGVAVAASSPDLSDAPDAPSSPPATNGPGDGDAGPLALLNDAKTYQDAPAAPDLTQRVVAETQRLDSVYPAQAPGAPTPAGIPTWQSVGPTKVIHDRIDGYTGPIQIKASENGRVRKILVDPRDPNVVYVLFGAGGLWKTTNFLQQHPTWTPLTDQLHTLSSGSIAFGRTPDTIYLGLGDPFDAIALNGDNALGGVMLKSADGGLTWSSPVKLPGANFVNDIAVDTSGSTDIVMAATDGGLFRSADGGVTYASIQGASVDDPATPYDDQLFNLTTTWSLVRTSLGWVVAATNYGELDFSNGFLAYSTDHGATWTPESITGVAYGAGSRGTLAVGTPGDNVVYAFQARAYPNQDRQRDVYRSVNGGRSWTRLHTTTTAPVNPTPETPAVWVAFNQAWYDQLIWVDPTDPARNTVFIGGDLYTAKTTDGGQSWRMMTHWLGAYGLPYLHADEHAAAYVPGKQPLLVVGNDGGLAVSPDGGASWSFDKNDGIAAAAVYGIASTPADPNKILIGTQDTGTLLRLGNTGFFNQVIGGDGVVPALSQANNAATLGDTFEGQILRSTDNTPNMITKWSLSRSPDNDAYNLTPLVAPTAAADPSGLVFYTYTQHKVLRTNDGGVTWNPILSANPASTPVVRFSAMNLAVDPQSADGVAIGGYGAIVRITHDSGATWASHSLLGIGGYGGFNSTVAWANANTLYVGSDNRAAGAVRLMRSTDGGVTWTAPGGAGLPDVPIVKLTPDLSDPTGHTLFAGTWIGVFRTTDGGASWSLFGAGMPHAYVSDIYVTPDGSFIRAATYGRGVWEASLR